MVTKNKNYRKIILVIVLTITAVSLAVIVGVKHFSKENTELPVGGVNYNPPTDTEKKETDEHKERLKEQEKSSNQGAGTGGTEVIITSLSAAETRGYISGIVEDGGICTLTLIRGGSKITETSTAIGDVNKTTCGPINIDPVRLSSGEWLATLSYSSSTVSGTSTTSKLKVP